MTTPYAFALLTAVLQTILLSVTVIPTVPGPPEAAALFLPIAIPASAGLMIVLRRITSPSAEVPIPQQEAPPPFPGTVIPSNGLRMVFSSIVQPLEYVEE